MVDPGPRQRRSGATGEGRSTRSERGSGLIGTSLSLVVALLFLLFATQTLVSLYAVSHLTAVAYDGARLAAGARGGADAEDAVVAAASRAQAEAHVRSLVGADTTLDWSGSDRDVVRLTIRAPKPRLLALGGLGSQHIERTVEVRVERLR